MTENQPKKYSSQFNWFRVIYLTEWNDAFIGDFNFDSIADVIKYLQSQNYTATIIWKVEDDEETTEKDYWLADEVQKIHKEFAKDKAKLQEEACRSALGHGAGRCNLLFDGEISELSGEIPPEPN